MSSSKSDCIQVADLIRYILMILGFKLLKIYLLYLKSEGLWWKDDKLVIPKAARLYYYFESIMTHPRKWHSISMDLITLSTPTLHSPLYTFHFPLHLPLFTLHNPLPTPTFHSPLCTTIPCLVLLKVYLVPR